jgi:hypothetical protein
MIENVAGFTDEAAEQTLEAALADIEGMLRQDVDRGWEDELSESGGLDLLGAVEAWAGLASATVGRLYAPASPWPRRQLAGWAKSIAKRLRQLTNLLLTPLRAAANALGASSYSIGLNFPWGVSVALNWP